jgi:dienelactone hydrolase
MKIDAFRVGARRKSQRCLAVSRGFAVASLVLCAAAAHAQTRLDVPGLDKRAGTPVSLIGYWFAVGGIGARPAVVMLHGCSGPYDQRGKLTTRMREYAALLNAEGWHALVVDSLTPRGENELCTQSLGGRAVTQMHRRLDALGAVQWLALRPDVDPKRLVLLGWSHGASTVLAATNRNQDAVRNADVVPRAAVAFYPGCAAELKRGYAPSAPLLMLLGARDDWTPAQPCVELARRVSGEPKPQVEIYADAFHGFDSKAPLRVRKEVPGGVNPGQGVTVGGHPQALKASRQALLAFLREQLR